MRSNIVERTNGQPLTESSLETYHLEKKEKKKIRIALMVIDVIISLFLFVETRE